MGYVIDAYTQEAFIAQPAAAPLAAGDPEPGFSAPARHPSFKTAHLRSSTTPSFCHNLSSAVPTSVAEQRGCFESTSRPSFGVRARVGERGDQHSQAASSLYVHPIAPHRHSRLARSVLPNG